MAEAAYGRASGTFGGVFAPICPCGHGQVLRTLLSLRIKEVQMKKDLEDSKPQKTFMNNKDKKKNLSRMQRKV